MRARYVAKGHRGLLITKLARMSSNTRSQALRFVLLAGCELLRRSDKRCSLAPQQLVLQLAEVGLMMSTATGERGPNEPNNEKHSESIKQKTMGNTGIAYEAPVANKNVRKNIRRASFAVYFGGFPNRPLCKFRNRLWDFRMSLGAAGKRKRPPSLTTALTLL